MLVKGIRWAALIVSLVAIAAGCQTSTSVKSDSARSPAAPVMDATGGSAAWQQCRQFEVTGVVVADQDDGSVYLTQHTFRVSPWSHAMSISAHEPQGDCTWQLVGHQFQWIEGNPELDISPLRPDYEDYAEAVMEILTAPVRLLEWDAKPAGNSPGLTIGGQPYVAIEAGSSTGIERVYYRNENSSRIDIIWLANKDRSRFVMVRGYEYARVPFTGIQIPTEFEVFRSGPSRQIGSRFARVDLRRVGW